MVIIAALRAGFRITTRPDTGVDRIPTRWRVERIRCYQMFEARHIHGPSIECIVETAPAATATGRETQVCWCFEGRCGEHSIERFKQRITPTPKGRVVDLLTEGSERFPLWCVHVQKDGLTSLLLSTRR